MASIRRGYSDDFVLKNGRAGIGSSNPQDTLDVVDGVVKGQDLKTVGVSSFTGYEGFLNSDQTITETVSITGGASLSGEIIVGTGQTVTVTGVGLGTTTVGNGSGTITNTIDSNETNLAGGSQIECLKVYNTFTPPSGGTNERPYAPKPGELYYNYGFKTIEFFDGYGWRQVDNTTRSGRGVFMGGFDATVPSPSFTTEISYINILSLGNTQGFGDVTPNVGGGNAGLGNATRGLVAGGFNPGYTDTIEYITIASEGDSIDFGNLTDARRYPSGASSSTRGVFAGGYSPGVVNVIDYVEITTIGNALNFGDLSEEGEAMGTATSPTRACFAGGRHPSTDEVIDYITMASTGDAIDFGDLTQARDNFCYHTSSSSTRGIFAGGIIPAQVNTIDYITIAATGNATDFGDLTETRRLAFNVSTQTRAVFAAGFDNVQSMDYITIASAANATDFGEMVGKRRYSGGACSDSHGGLGGF